MEFVQVVRSTPGQYISEKGALASLVGILKNFERPYIITGEKSYAAFLKHLPQPLEGVPVLRYDHTASYEDMDRLAKLAADADVIVAVGGGKLCDTAKGTADRLHCEVVTVPTIVGTCAPTTPVAAVYHPNGVFNDVAYFKRTPYACVVDLDLLVESPKRYFEGGICDTVAKWYEAESITRHLTGALEANVELGLAAAKVTKDILLRDTHAALATHALGVVNDTFKRVVDTVFNVAAAVGCFACEYGRMSGAHAVHNALSQFTETHTIEHGVKVAYGLLVMLAAMGEEGETQKLIDYCKDNGFIYSWQQLEVQEDMATAVAKVADFSASEKETFKLAVPGVTPEQVQAAVYQVESLAQAK